MRRQRGFSLIIVFLLVIAMVGAAAAVLLATQTDLQVTGHDRELNVGLSAAETGVAYAKDWIALRVGAGMTGSDILASGANELCVCDALPPGPPAANCRPVAAQPKWRWRAGTPTAINPGTLPCDTDACFQFCVHNNALDPSYPAAAGNVTDGDGILAVETWGWGPTGAASRLTVEMRVGTTLAPTAGEYFKAGGGPLNQAFSDESATVAATQRSF